MDNLDAIEKRLQHVSSRVRGANENALGEVEFDIQIVIPESVSLFRVKQLEQCRRDIAFECIEADLIDLVNDYDWVLNVKFLELADKDTWLGVYVSSLAALNVHRVILAAHTDDGGRSLQTLADRVGNSGLADTWRTC